MYFVDYSKGFGGKFGLQSDRQDTSALGYGGGVNRTELHPSQVDMKKRFGGKFGIEDSKDQVLMLSVLQCNIDLVMPFDWSSKYDDGGFALAIFSMRIIEG